MSGRNNIVRQQISRAPFIAQLHRAMSGIPFQWLLAKRELARSSPPLIQPPAPIHKEIHMADLEQLKSKYAGVISTLQEFADLGAKVDRVDLDGEKLHVKGTVPSKVVLNRVWDAI